MSQRQGMNDNEPGVNRIWDDTAGARPTLDDAVAVTRRIMANYHHGGDVTLWRSLMRERSVWMGTGSSILFGADAIVAHYREFAVIGTARIIREEYHELRSGDGASVVFGKLVTRPDALNAAQADALSGTVGPSGGSPVGEYLTLFSLTYAMDDDGLALLTQHYSFEMLDPDVARRIRIASAGSGEVPDAVPRSEPPMRVDARVALRILDDMSHELGGWDSPQMKAAAYLVSRNSSFVDPPSRRISVRANSQVVYLDPRMMLYAESRGHRTQIVTLSKALSCTMPLGELAVRLPGYFYRVHRGYLVNVHYITAIRRNEVELASGVVIPIPMPKYSATKKALEELIAREEGDGDAEGCAR